MDHSHHQCEHASLAHCRHCNVVYCKSCKQEWGQSYTWAWPEYQWPPYRKDIPTWPPFTLCGNDTTTGVGTINGTTTGATCAHL